MGHIWMGEMFFCLSIALSLSLFISLQVFLSGKQKTAAAIATESKGRPGPGLSPLEHPDWSRPTVWALLLCGQWGRQFSERCRGRRAISAVLSGWIYTGGSKLNFSLICCRIKRNLSVTAHINFIVTKDQLIYSALQKKFQWSMQFTYVCCIIHVIKCMFAVCYALVDNMTDEWVTFTCYYFSNSNRCCAHWWLFL